MSLTVRVGGTEYNGNNNVNIGTQPYAPRAHVGDLIGVPGPESVNRNNPVAVGIYNGLLGPLFGTRRIQPAGAPPVNVGGWRGQQQGYPQQYPQQGYPQQYPQQGYPQQYPGRPGW